MSHRKQLVSKATAIRSCLGCAVVCAIGLSIGYGAARTSTRSVRGPVGKNFAVTDVVHAPVHWDSEARDGIGEAVAGTFRREPIALALIEDKSRLLVLNRSGGTLAIFNTSTGQLVREYRVGKSPSDMFLHSGGDLLILDSEEHLLRRWNLQDDEITLLEQVSLPTYPMQLSGNPDGTQLLVASRWSRQLTFLSVGATSEAKIEIQQVIDLDFVPHELHFVASNQARSGRWIVADAFGGQLAQFDPTSLECIRQLEIPSHNIRGLASSLDRESLLVSHQMLNELAHTVRNDVHWGLLMSNDLRWLKMSSLCDWVEGEEPDVLRDSHMHPLGGAGDAAGDPNGICLTSKGVVLVALGGVDEVAIGREEDFSLRRIEVGDAPVEVVADADGSRAYVANRLDDSVTVIDIARESVVDTLEVGAGWNPDEVAVGERLFFDANLSHDGWMSCHSCHTDGHTNGMLNDNLSDGSFGAPKRVLSLLGVADTLPLAWSGEVGTIRQQLVASIQKTMQGSSIPADESLQALEAYVVTLAPPPGIDAARGNYDEASAERGSQLFERLDCVRCHAPTTYSTVETYDVDLTDEMGRARFNPPSLLGVSQRDRLFHDNRAIGLRDVIVRFEHQLPRELSESEINDLIQFLRLL